jgi:uroporphyrinogen-III synthase
VASETRGRPLQGKRIVVTRAEDQAPALAERLRALGAQVELCPAIAIAPPLDFAPLDAALRQLRTYDWLILTSANGVRAVFDRLADLSLAPDPWPPTPRLAAIGPATAAKLERRGLRPTFVPSAYVAEAILAEIGHVAGQRILLPRADIARQALASGLRQRGAVVDEIAAYRTLPGPGAARLLELLERHGAEAITFTSSSTVRYLLQGLEQAGLERSAARRRLNQLAIACIGPVTAATARQ